MVNVVWSNSLPQHVEKIKLVMSEDATPTNNNHNNTNQIEQGYDTAHREQVDAYEDPLCVGDRTCQTPTPPPTPRQNRFCKDKVRENECHEDPRQDCLPIRETNHSYDPEDDADGNDYGKAEDIRDALAAAAPEPLEK